MDTWVNLQIKRDFKRRIQCFLEMCMTKLRVSGNAHLNEKTIKKLLGVRRG